ncbi:MAG: ParB N-terminal domain-containing protein [Subdoligranulum variabile]|nr:ParB N-terminal domain-containing protein [Subdoligranulum variabile]
MKAKADSNAAGELKMLPLEALEPSSRNFYRMCEIDQLADSIAANGLEQNLVVKAETGGKYRIVTGHRRYQALLRLMSRGVRIQTVPCIVRPAESDAQEMLRMIASNQYRELTDYEKMVQVEQATTAVKTLRSVKVAELGGIRLDGPTREVVSRLTGMSGPAVSKYAGIAEKLIPELKARMEQGLLPFTVAYAACRYPAGWQRQVFKQHQLACDAGPVSEALVTGVAYSNAVKEALYSSVSDTIDPTADEAGNVERLKKEWCRNNAGASIPGAGFVDCAPDKITITGAGNNWRVEMTPTRFVIVALGMWKSMCTGRWKQEEARKRFKDVSREALDRMDGELEELVEEPTGERQAAEGLPSSAAAAAPSPEGEGSERELPPPPPTADPADAEEKSAVESGRFGELRNALSGKSAALEDKAWDQIIVWNREPPPEDVYAVVHYRIEDSEMEGLAYWHKARGVWSMDEYGAYALEADVLGWFRVPKWEG